MTNRVLKEDILQNLLDTIVSAEEPTNGFYLLYAPKQVERLTAETKCAIVLSLHDEDEDYVPKEETLENYISVAIVNDLITVIEIARSEKPSASASELVKAINYYLENDAFIDMND